MTAGWEYVGSDWIAGQQLKFYRCPTCRAIVTERYRDQHMRKAHRLRITDDAARPGLH